MCDLFAITSKCKCQCSLKCLREISVEVNDIPFIFFQCTVLYIWTGGFFRFALFCFGNGVSIGCMCCHSSFVDMCCCFLFYKYLQRCARSPPYAPYFCFTFLNYCLFFFCFSNQFLYRFEKQWKRFPFNFYISIYSPLIT